jgi:hypothetical protein
MKRKQIKRSKGSLKHYSKKQLRKLVVCLSAKLLERNQYDY